jgi:hypothetical protein
MSQGGGSPISGFGAIPMLTIEDDKAVQGIAFSVRKRITLAALAVSNIVIDPTGFTGKLLVFEPIGWDSIGGPYQVDVYAGITANNDGTPLGIFNRNFDSSIVSELVISQDPTGISTVGAEGPIELLSPSNGVGVANASGSSASDAIVSVLDPTKKYLIRITNTDGTTTGTFALKSDHFEVPQDT